jgi:hypothetical protein
MDKQNPLVYVIGIRTTIYLCCLPYQPYTVPPYLMVRLDALPAIRSMIIPILAKCFQVATLHWSVR